jgi:hypothetical protein
MSPLKLSSVDIASGIRRLALNDIGCFCFGSENRSRGAGPRTEKGPPKAGKFLRAVHTESPALLRIMKGDYIRVVWRCWAPAAASLGLVRVVHNHPDDYR